MHECPYCGEDCECDAFDELEDGEAFDICLHICDEMGYEDFEE